MMPAAIGFERLGKAEGCSTLSLLPNISISHRTIHLSTNAMALNWTMLKHDRSPIPLPNEHTITSIETGADLSLTVPDVPPTTSSSTAGGSGGAKKLKASGRIWLTDQRVRGSIIPLRFRCSLDLSWWTLSSLHTSNS